MMITIEVKDNPLGVEREWRELPLQSSTATFFQSFDWAQVWFKHFSKNIPYILTVRKASQLLAIAPFLKNGSDFSFWGTEEILGGELVTDYGDIIAIKDQEEVVWPVILNHFDQLGANLDLHFLREESPSLRFLKSYSGLNLEIEIEDVAPFIRLPSAWEDYLAGLKRKERQELRRKIRRLESLGAFEICKPENLREGMRDFFRLMRLSNDQKRNFLKPEIERFFEEFACLLTTEKMIDLCFLDFEGQRIAATLSFVCKNEILLYNSGFDPAFSYLAPGFLLKAFLIKAAISKRKSKFDFLRGNERYKYDLGAQDQNLYHVTFKGKK
ncbi:GNAT family N-acetyltransferase [Candidatus Microgenomates bacterium]|nr:GNAT family N-acetyltransferase [Candidatus Microgenomates bacterium]